MNPRFAEAIPDDPDPSTPHAGGVKVVLLAESFLPHMNGVTHSLLQALRHLEHRGHEALVIAPRSGPIDHTLYGARAVLLPSVPLPSYPDVRVTLAGAHRLAEVMRAHEADVVHLASPFVLGWRGVLAAESLGIPSVAVYQTDIPSYAERYGVPGAAPALNRHLGRLHRRATLTLAPSSSAVEKLESLGVDRLRLWRRGVDTERFSPGRRDEGWRREIAPGGEVLVGYVGRLAPEKQVEDLRAIAALPGVRLVVIGEGPSRAELERMLPDARFTGFLGGDELARAMASLDVFVHPGESETFCQTVQEAMASGVPVVATGRGGPVDLVQSSANGWLYRPGDLEELRDRVRDLTGDDAKRRAFGERARESVAGRGWDRLGDELIGHYETAMGRSNVTATDAAAPMPFIPDAGPAASVPPALPAAPAAAPRRWSRYVAVGDSLTEGLCDTSRVPAGEYRGWADRLAMLIAVTRSPGEPVAYANLAVRSRKVRDAIDVQLPQAAALGADLVSVLIGANDLVGRRADPERLVRDLGVAVSRLRSTGCDVLLVTPFLPRRPATRFFTRRFRIYNARLRELAEATGSLFLDVEARPELVDDERWAQDRVHLNAAGHRGIAYAAARVLGVQDAGVLGELEHAVHDQDEDIGVTAVGDAEWLLRHAVPWLRRRLAGRAAGDGRVPKRAQLLPVTVPATDRGPRKTPVAAARSAVPGE